MSTPQTGATTGPLPQFDTPAFQNDLTDPSQAKELSQEWSESVNRWTETAILGDPWTVLNDNNRIYYYNPLDTDIPSEGTTAALISWIAFPNRILVTYPNNTFEQQMSFAEGGPHDDGSFGPPPPVNGKPYNPVGQRGWQDEYCEWISQRNSSGKITQVDFTCENPEYWFVLWRIDPQRVLTLYQQLVSPSVQLADLQLLDQNGQPVIERETGRPAYSPINKWNNQPSAGATTGAVHLISPPNTLGAEIYLAAAATLLRDNPPGTPVTDPSALILCSRYGTPNRNSDPHIGSQVNNVIRGGGVELSLENPVGLYIQMPDFSSYQLPSDPHLPTGAQPSDCWQIIRGQETIAGFAGNFILHARFALPQAWIDAGVSFTVGDIMIQGNPIQFGAQITQTFQIALRGLAIPTTLPAEQPQACQAPNPTPLPAPQQLQDLNLFQAGSTSTAVVKVEQGQTTPNIALVTFAAQQGATIEFQGGGVTATTTKFQNLGGNFQLFVLSIDVTSSAPLGDQSLLLTNPDGTHGPAAPGLLTIVPPGSLGTATDMAAKAALGAPAAPEAIDLSNLDYTKIRARNRY